MITRLHIKDQKQKNKSTRNKSIYYGEKMALSYSSISRKTSNRAPFFRHH
jgi:hypothetical protein